MKRVTLFVLSAVFASAALGSFLTVDTGTYPGTAPEINWWGYAVYLNDQGEPGVGVAISGNLSLFDFYDTRVDNVAWSTLSGSWEQSYVSSLPWATCYRTGINAQTFDKYELKYGSQTCTPGGPVYPDPGPYPIEQPSGGGTCPYMCTPIVLDLEDAKYEFSSAREGVLFDIKGDGQPVRVAWPEDPASVAFLFADRNGNGFPDDGSELFGNARRLRSGPLAANGFQALAEFDSDGDGTITSNDGPWNDLGLWFDGNRDGKGALSEIMPLRESGIVWLGIHPVRIGKHDEHGNMFHLKARFGIDRNGKMKQRSYFDVYLTAVP
jgi:hypothetical protein